MGMSNKIRALLKYKGITQAELAHRLDTVPSNIYKKIARDNFSEKELIKIAEALDCKYEGFFFLENDGKI